MSAPAKAPRKGYRNAWGTIAPRVRVDLKARGVLKVSDYARETGLDAAAVQSSLKEGAKRGDVVHALGVYWHPEAWRVTMGALESWRKIGGAS